MFGDRLEQFDNLSNIIDSDRNFGNMKRYFINHIIKFTKQTVNF